MDDKTELERLLAGLAESGRRNTVPRAAQEVRARGEQRRRRRRAAVASGGALLAVAVAAGGLSLAMAGRGTEPPAHDPAPAASPFEPPTPAPGEEYATELGYVYGAVAQGATVRVTVEQLRMAGQAAVPSGVVHTLTLPRATLVEARRLAGGHPTDVELGDLAGELSDGQRWIFAIDYDGDGRVQSLREAYWLAG
ncbi:hypothetical protein [Streptomyces hoynatensis]|uniref:Uncharacterized protein n=1 Tax=Streptomyces hoynatensis TaxID=1141874 RepID=A0A3A9YWQ0_9ACTN|nr:hypothetical protein [Streptomyces hoynatensis]RKN40044.1 hypothetical protein D7294_19175 [Streptomyces hoynatensis]